MEEGGIVGSRSNKLTLPKEHSVYTEEPFVSIPFCRNILVEFHTNAFCLFPVRYNDILLHSKSPSYYFILVTLASCETLERVRNAFWLNILSIQKEFPPFIEPFISRAEFTVGSYFIESWIRNYMYYGD